jgi:hypothetical protein
MKWFLFTALLIIYSCRGNSLGALSPDQKGLFNLSETFKNEYKDTSDSREREKLVKQYEIKLQDYLRHSCDYILKDVKVHVRKVEVDSSGRLLAEFTDKNCRYLVHRYYRNDLEMKADSVYHLVRSLNENADITLRFLFDGNIKVNDFENASNKIFEIEVTPTEIAHI